MRRDKCASAIAVTLYIEQLVQTRMERRETIRWPQPAPPPKLFGPGPAKLLAPKPEGRLKSPRCGESRSESGTGLPAGDEACDELFARDMLFE